MSLPSFMIFQTLSMRKVNKSENLCAYFVARWAAVILLLLLLFSSTPIPSIPNVSGKDLSLLIVSSSFSFFQCSQKKKKTLSPSHSSVLVVTQTWGKHLQPSLQLSPLSWAPKLYFWQENRLWPYYKFRNQMSIKIGEFLPSCKTSS